MSTSSNSQHTHTDVYILYIHTNPAIRRRSNRFTVKTREGELKTMAPKRSGKKKAGTVVRSTRRVVKETVEITVVQGRTQESTQEDQNGEAEDIDVPAGEPVRTIPVEEQVLEEEVQTIEVSVEEPNKDVAIDGSQEQEEPSREEERKEDQTSEVSREEPTKEEDRREEKTSEVSQEESSKEEDRREEQTNEFSQEQPSKEEDRKEGQTSEISQEQLSKEKPNKDTSAPSTGDQQERSKEETQEGKEAGRKERTQKGKGNERRRKRKWGTTEGGHGYKRYVFRVLKQVHPDLRISSMAMSVINSLMNDIFERIGDEAAKLSRYKNRRTLSSGEIQGAVKLVLPGELGKHAIAEGSKAVANYMSYEAKRFKS